MSILSCYCRGLAAAATIRELKDMCRVVQPNVLFLMETRVPKERIENVKQRLKFDHVFWVEPRGLSGGLALFWKKGILLQVQVASPNFIHSLIEVEEMRKSFNCSFIYGNPTYQLRRSL